ncbi:MAG: Zn-dependent oligopeptidase [Armatimonadetes bacterium]|nr:Zn-dependent oligopeptidase [Armatimonadota bacterium]
MHSCVRARSALVLAALSIVSPAITQEVPQSVKDALKRADEAVAKIIAVPDADRNFDNTLGALDDLSVRLDNDTSLVAFQQFVSTDAAERDAARATDEAVTNWGIELSKREDLYKAIKAYADTNPKLEGEKKRMLDFTMRDYRRAGMMLPADQRERLKQIEMELNKLGIEFEQNINEDDTRVPLFPSELKGVPKDVIDRQESARGLVLLGLDGPSYGPVMDYCENESTRQKCWMTYRRRAGDKNVRILERLVKLRADEAKILGYKNTVDYEVETRMAKNSESIAKFYRSLEPLVRQKAEADMAELLALKRKLTKNPKATFNPWDYAFYKNLLLKQKYAVDSEKVSEYFPMQRVVDGLFKVAQDLFAIDLKDVTANAKSLGLPLWHPDVKLYEVTDRSTHQILGHMYTDLYPRPNKYNHAACWGLQARKVWADGTVQKPLAALVCNFTKPTADKPSLLPHDEVETFFHEFGHGLHQLLTETSLGRFSGTAVARDFVEAPSQMLENWVWDPKVLKLFAKHYKTGAAIPDALVEGMRKAHTLGSGIETQGQLYLGEMDQAFHTVPSGVVDTTKVDHEVYERTTLYKSVPHTMFQASFGHLVGYEGAYYGYLWSLVFAQDMFTRFEKLGPTNPEAGMYYRKRILARGGSMDETDMLRDYLGREPNTEAFYRHLGLTKK